MTKTKIVILTDNRDLTGMIEIATGGSETCTFIHAENGLVALSLMESLSDIDLVIAQLPLIPCDKESFLRHAEHDGKKVPVWAMSGGMTPDLSRSLIKLGFKEAINTLDVLQYVREFLPQERLESSLELAHA